MEWRKAGFAELDLFITTIVTDTDGGQKTESVEAVDRNAGELRLVRCPSDPTPFGQGAMRSTMHLNSCMVHIFVSCLPRAALTSFACPGLSY
jgi:hypothetical protein